MSEGRDYTRTGARRHQWSYVADCNSCHFVVASLISPQDAKNSDNKLDIAVLLATLLTFLTAVGTVLLSHSEANGTQENLMARFAGSLDDLQEELLAHFRDIKRDLLEQDLSRLHIGILLWQETLQLCLALLFIRVQNMSRLLGGFVFLIKMWKRRVFSQTTAQQFPWLRSHNALLFEVEEEIKRVKSQHSGLSAQLKICRLLLEVNYTILLIYVRRKLNQFV
jgi:hypothetical protein